MVHILFQVLKTHFLFLFIWIAILPIYANAHSEDEHFIINRITSENGLPNASVWSITQDQDGFIWLGTSYGLIRYDGIEFKSYTHNPNDSTTINSNRIDEIYLGPGGDLWIKTLSGGGLNRYNHNLDNFHRYKHQPGEELSLNSNGVTCFFTDSNKRLWVGTESGLNIYDPSHDHFRQVLDFEGNQLGYVHKIVESSDGRIFIASRNGLKWVDLYKFKYQAFGGETEADWKDWSIRSMYFDQKSNILWVGSYDQGLLVFKLGNKELELKQRYSASFNKPIYRIVPRGEHELWVQLSNSALIRCELDQNHNIGTEKIFSYQNTDTARLSDPKIRSLLIDSRNQLWIGTDGGGVNFYQEESESFQFFISDRTNYTLTGNSIVSIFEDHQQGIWIGTYGSGLNYISNSNKGFEKFGVHYGYSDKSHHLANPLVLDFAESRNQNIWIATNGGGLHLLDINTGEISIFQRQEGQINTLINNKLAAVIEDKNGLVWMGTSGSGIESYDPQKGIYRNYAHRQGVEDEYIYSLLQDDEGRIWAASRKDIYIYEPVTDRFLPFNRIFPECDKEVKLDNIWSLFQDHQGQIWMGSEGNGLIKFDPKHSDFTVYQNDDDTTSISSNDIWDIYEDKNHKLYLATNYGLNILDPQTEEFTHFSVKDGLPNNSVVAVLKDENNNIWMTTKGGLALMNPQHKVIATFAQEDGLQSNEFFPAALKSSSGKVYLGGINGFNAFNPGDIRLYNTFKPPVAITELLVDNSLVKAGDTTGILGKSIHRTDKIKLHYKHRILAIGFRALNFVNADDNQYSFRLYPFEEEWQYVNDQNIAVYTNLTPGDYTFEVKGANNDGIWNENPVRLQISIPPPWWQTWWSKIGITLFILSSALIVLNRRFNQLEKKSQQLERVVAERTSEIANQNDEIKVQQQSILDKNIELEQRNKELKALNQERDQFMQIVAHDLKAPLNRLKGLLQIIDISLETKSEQEHMFELAYQVIDDGGKLIQDMLDIYDFDKKKKIKPKLEELRVLDLVDLVLKSFEKETIDKNITIETDISDLIIETDRRYLSRILDNLISNAIKFSPPFKHIVIELKVDKISGGVQCTVRDQGPGIDPQEQKELFKMFKKLTPRPTAGESSHGLGLSIVKYLVEGLHGKISVDSRPGMGTAFKVMLPAKWKNRLETIHS